MMGRRGAHKILVGKPEENRPIGRPRSTSGMILKWIFKK
jgi:hypothetical protein